GNTLTAKVRDRVREHTDRELVWAVTDLEVQVRTAGVSSRSYSTNHLSGCDGLSLAYCVSCKVSVQRVLAVRQLDNDVVTVSCSSETVTRVNNRTVGDCLGRCPLRGAQVETGVSTTGAADASASDDDVVTD